MTEQITLTGPAATLLATLYGRALDARSPHMVLGDPTAAATIAKIDYDWSRLGIRPSAATGVALRARFLDRWTREFLATHPDATVLHLGCGLDTRVDRIDPRPTVRWFDVDQPDVIALRERLYPARDGAAYRTVAADVTDPGWLADVPRDRPALVVAEGLTMYLPAAQGPVLLRGLVEHLPSGELVFDTYSRFGIRITRRMPALRATGSRLDWGIDDPRELERAVPGLRLVTAAGAFDTADPSDDLPSSLRWQIAVLGRLPGLRSVGALLRFAFG